MHLIDDFTRSDAYTKDSDLAVWAANSKLTVAHNLPPRSRTAHEKNRPFSSDQYSLPKYPHPPDPPLHDDAVVRPVTPALLSSAIHDDTRTTTAASDLKPLSSNPLDPQPPALLLTLPPEIRHQIYLHLPDTLISTRPLIYCLTPFANRRSHCLASVCRLMRSEALALYYSQNTWAIKLEYALMYDAFLTWIRGVGTHTTNLRVLQISLRSELLTPGERKSIIPPPAGRAKPEGDAMFEVDLSEKWIGGRVVTMRSEGSPEATERVRIIVEDVVRGLWERRKEDALEVEDLIVAVELLMDMVRTRWWIDRKI